MGVVLWILGFLIGLFMWSNIFGSIFGTLPVEMRAVKAGLSGKVHWPMVIIPVLIAVVVLTLASVFSKNFLYGSLCAGVIMMFNIGKLRSEAVDNFQSKNTQIAGVKKRTPDS